MWLLPNSLASSCLDSPSPPSPGPLQDTVVGLNSCLSRPLHSLFPAWNSFPPFSPKYGLQRYFFQEALSNLASLASVSPLCPLLAFLIWPHDCLFACPDSTVSSLRAKAGGVLCAGFPSSQHSTRHRVGTLFLV